MLAATPAPAHEPHLRIVLDILRHHLWGYLHLYCLDVSCDPACENVKLELTLFGHGRPLLFSKHETDLFSYEWPAGTAGLGYVPIGIGFVASAATAALTQDRIYKHLSRRFGTSGLPEYRLVLTQVRAWACQSVGLTQA